MGRWVKNGWMDKLMGWMNDGWMHGWIDRWLGRWMKNGWMDG